MLPGHSHLVENFWTKISLIYTNQIIKSITMWLAHIWDLILIAFISRHLLKSLSTLLSMKLWRGTPPYADANGRKDRRESWNIDVDHSNENRDIILVITTLDKYSIIWCQILRLQFISFLLHTRKNDTVVLLTYTLLLLCLSFLHIDPFWQFKIENQCLGIVIRISKQKFISFKWCKGHKIYFFSTETDLFTKFELFF